MFFKALQKISHVEFSDFLKIFIYFFRSQDGENGFGFLGNPLPKTKEMLSFTKEISSTPPRN